MEPDLRGNLKELLELTRENNKLLHKAHNRARWGIIIKSIYWIVIIGFTIGAFYYIQPYLNGAVQNYQKSMTLLEHIQNAGGNIPDVQAIKSIFGNFGSSTATSSMSQSAWDAFLKFIHAR